MQNLPIILATNNKNKKIEFSHILNTNTLSPSDFNIIDFNPIEHGNTFEENAIIKAKAFYNILKTNKDMPREYIIVADDSGLCVDSINDEPGIFSARYANICNNIVCDSNSNDEDNRKSLIQKLKSNNLWGSKAFFKCSIAYIKYSQEKLIQNVVSGKCDGIVAIKELGSNGFGYDCMFYIDFSLDEMQNIDFTMQDSNKTSNYLKSLKHSFATLSLNKKSLISHRYKAIKEFEKYCYASL